MENNLRLFWFWAGWQYLKVPNLRPQLISKFQNVIWCIQIDQKTNKQFVTISALAPKKKSNQKKSLIRYIWNN